MNIVLSILAGLLLTFEIILVIWSIVIFAVFVTDPKGFVEWVKDVKQALLDIKKLCKGDK